MYEQLARARQIEMRIEREARFNQQPIQRPGTGTILRRLRRNVRPARTREATQPTFPIVQPAA